MMTTITIGNGRSSGDLLQPSQDFINRSFIHTSSQSYIFCLGHSSKLIKQHWQQKILSATASELRTITRYLIRGDDVSQNLDEGQLEVA